MSLLGLLDEETAPKGIDELPDWVSKENGSYIAYQAIGALKLDKLAYIKKHTRAVDFKAKKKYHISQLEVAAAVNMARTGLFSHGPYAAELKKFLSDTNDALEQVKERKLKPKGLRAECKEDVIKKAIDYKSECKYWKNKKIEEFYDSLLGKMPLKDRQKLGLL